MKTQALCTHPPEVSEKKIKIAAHDLNNLIHNVLNGVELLKDKISDDNSILNLVKIIEKNSVLASDIINQLSHQNNSHKETRTKVNLAQVITETITLFGKSSKHPVEIDFERINTNYTIWGNYTDLQRVIFNLLINAEESIHEKPKIKIFTEVNEKDDNQGSDFVKISISDNGCGIPYDILDNIFKEGYSTKLHKNKGLGLSIVKSILKNHHGKIEVKSEKNVGTTFTLCIPTYLSTLNKRQLENKKVVIAEDDDFQREVLKDLLKSLKINVFTASNGIEALELCITTKPDLIFIDESMPRMTGLQCTKKIREIDKSSQIVLVTGSDINEKELMGNVSKVLKKPYNFEMVKSVLNELF